MARSAKTNKLIRESWIKHYSANRSDLILNMQIALGLPTALSPSREKLTDSTDPFEDNTGFHKAKVKLHPKSFDFSTPTDNPDADRSSGKAEIKPQSMEDAIAIREKTAEANQIHQETLSRLAKLIRNLGYSNISEDKNTFDLVGDAPNGGKFLFEVKSINQVNVASQFRKAIVQLIEYRHKLKQQMGDAIIDLCIALNTKPDSEELKFYMGLCQELNIAVVVIRLDGSAECLTDFKPDHFG